MKKIYKILLFFILVFIVSCDKKEKHLTSKDICDEKLPPFIEKFDNQFDKKKLKLLCDCIWNNQLRGSYHLRLLQTLVA